MAAPPDPSLVQPAAPDRGTTLEDEFRAALPSYPTVLEHARQAYRVVMGDQVGRSDDEWVIELMWRGVAFSERPEDRAAGELMRARLGGLPGIGVAAGVELAVRSIVGSLANELRAQRLRWSAIHPVHHRRFEPDPGLLDCVLGSDRVRNQITDANDVRLPDIRFHRVPADEPVPTVVTSVVPMPEPKPYAGSPQPPTKTEWLITTLKERAVPTSNAGWHDFALEGMKACGKKPHHSFTDYAIGFHPLTLRRNIHELRKRDKIP